MYLSLSALSGEDCSLLRLELLYYATGHGGSVPPFVINDLTVIKELS